MAEIALDQGRLDESERLFHEALHIWRAAEYRSVIASATGNLARLAAHRGEFDEARRGFDEALAEADHVGGQAERREILARKAECLLLGGDGEGALALAEECLEQIRSSDGVPPQLPLLERVRGIVLFGLGDDGEGRVALEASLRAVAETAPSSTDDEVEEWRRRSDEILGELGVEWVPTMVRMGY